MIKFYLKLKYYEFFFTKCLLVYDLTYHMSKFKADLMVDLPAYLIHNI